MPSVFSGSILTTANGRGAESCPDNCIIEPGFYGLFRVPMPYYYCEGETGSRSAVK